MRFVAIPLAVAVLFIFTDAFAARSCRLSLSGFTKLAKEPNTRDHTSDQNGNNDEIQTFIRDNGDKATFVLYNVDTKTRYTYNLHDSPMHFEMRPIEMRHEQLFFVEETENIRFTHTIRIVNSQTGGLRTIRVPKNVIRLLETFGVGDRTLVLRFALQTGQSWITSVRL